MSETATTPLTDTQADEGFCCRSVCCGPGSWCCGHANPDHECSVHDVAAAPQSTENSHE